MTTVVATDLDRTLIWSERAAGGLGDAVCVEEYAGRPQSYLPADAVEQVRAMVAGGRLVPVTTRTEEQYRRVRLPGGPPRFAICLNGCRILVDGEEDADHRALVRAALRRAAPLAEASELLARWARTSGSLFGGHRVRHAEDYFAYAVFEDEVEPGAADLAEAADRLGWQASVQGRKVYVVPRDATKATALAHLGSAYGLEVVGAAGDSILDAGMLAAVARAWVPKGSELHRALLHPGHATVTAGEGLVGGAEIVAGFSALLAIE